MGARDWGTTVAERAAAYPCDAVLPDATAAWFRAVDVAAPSPLVFRWLCQMRIAPYSYDLIDNLGRRSPRELTPGLEAPVPGDPLMTIFRVVGVVPDRELTLTLPPPAGRLARLARRVLVPCAVTYRVDDRGAGGSRIVVKYVSRFPASGVGRTLEAVGAAADLVMMRRQLLTFRALAERDARRAAGATLG